MANRSAPYGAFNFTVNFDGGEVFGGFSDVSGIGTEVTMAEYRNGNDRENHVRKVVCLSKVSDVTLKRGVIDSKTLFDWIKETRNQGPSAQRRSVAIRLLDEAGQTVQQWVLSNVALMKYSGPTLAAKGSGDLALEEIVLSAEGLSIEA